VRVDDGGRLVQGDRLVQRRLVCRAASSVNFGSDSPVSKMLGTSPWSVYLIAFSTRLQTMRPSGVRSISSFFDSVELERLLRMSVWSAFREAGPARGKCMFAFIRKCGLYKI
jgi:hypothetical protein